MNAVRILLCSLLIGAAGIAQGSGTGVSTGGSGSQSYFLSAVEFGSGGEADTFFYKIRSSVGSGVVVEPDASSTSYRIRGGFFGAFTAPMLGTPWITGASPMFVKPGGNPTLTLTGTELWLGSSPIVSIGGASAGVLSRTASQLQVTVPAQPVPGYQPVTFTTSAGTSFGVTVAANKIYQVPTTTQWSSTARKSKSRCIAAVKRTFSVASSALQE
jgi:hypothetical protein